MTIDVYQGPILVTVAYFVLWYYLLLILQRGTKYRLNNEYTARGELFDRYFGQDEQMLAADRAVANTHEQMMPFLFALWLHAIFVSPLQASWCGAVYVGLRSLYPLLLGRRLSRLQSKRVYFVTLPSYGIIFYLLATLAWAAIGR